MIRQTNRHRQMPEVSNNIKHV